MQISFPSNDASVNARAVSARGTEEGLVLRIDGKASWDEIISDLQTFLGGQRQFFVGGEILIEWLDRLPTLEQSKSLEKLLREEYRIEIATKRKPSNLKAERPKEEGSQENIFAHDPDHTTDHTYEEGSSVASSSYKTTVSNEQEESTQNASSSEPSGIGKLVKLILANNKTVEEDTKDLKSNILSTNNEASKLVDKLKKDSSSKTTGMKSTSGKSALNDSESFLKELLEENALDLINSGRLSPSGVRSDSNSSNSSSSAQTGRKYFDRVSRMFADDLVVEEEANAKVIFGTLRSGQRIETPYSLIVIGDVNPGADIVAGGDIVVFGSLKGTAHASAYDYDAIDKVIIALQMRPMQLRIGAVISRGSDDVVDGSEIARIENRRIVVESFSTKSLQLLGKKF